MCQRNFHSLGPKKLNKIIKYLPPMLKKEMPEKLFSYSLPCKSSLRLRTQLIRTLFTSYNDKIWLHRADY